jgi:phosphoglycolate phosphatase
MTGLGVAGTTTQAVLFDLDGTLIDSAPDLGHAANLMRAARGLPELPLAQYRPKAGAGARGMIGVAFADKGYTPEHPEFPALRAEFLDNYERCMRERTVVFEGVPDLVASLQGLGLAWGVVTNKIERFTLPLTAGMPLFNSARAIVSGDTTPHSKPHSAPLLEAARRLGLAPVHCVYVGDDERDIVAGKAAGMRTVAATYGYLGAKGDAIAWGADATIDAPEELLALLA